MMGFIFQQLASQYIISFNRTSESKVMVVRICADIPFQLLSAMIYYGPQSDIREKTFARRTLPESSFLHSECLNWFSALCRYPEEWLWTFLFAMGFIFQQRASQYIININRTPVSKVMVIWICMGIPYQLLSAIIYYRAQLDIQVKTFSCWNFLESSMLNSMCLNKFLAFCEDPGERLWLFVFAMGFIFQKRAS